MIDAGPPRWLDSFKAWPMLLAAAAMVGSGTMLVSGLPNAGAVGLVLIVLGAVLLGAWVALLAGHGYRGGGDG